MSNDTKSTLDAAVLVLGPLGIGAAVEFDGAAESCPCCRSDAAAERRAPASSPWISDEATDSALRRKPAA